MTGLIITFVICTCLLSLSISNYLLLKTATTFFHLSLWVNVVICNIISYVNYNFEIILFLFYISRFRSFFKRFIIITKL
ncbi:hypothetical protein BTU51_1120 [Rickettsia rickettsii]|uniref:Uncharacterized protein n=1 Tax=Rickettsia rickettsii (strain Iowa) TaxID=452659 RepID=B0BUJ9_RICRO|nr:hypothetical protein RrIowa_1120 [Rickettsia rickettsii str. Iowa]APU55859.1 hypothetical protein BTU50_1120 [Rickettsia rickettsii]APU57236.1 hypothetical protein BTU51_1120 [Rickettsia rickettsii]